MQGMTSGVHFRTGNVTASEQCRNSKTESPASFIMQISHCHEHGQDLRRHDHPICSSYRYFLFSHLDIKCQFAPKALFHSRSRTLRYTFSSSLCQVTARMGAMYLNVRYPILQELRNGGSDCCAERFYYQRCHLFVPT